MSYRLDTILRLRTREREAREKDLKRAAIAAEGAGLRLRSCQERLAALAREDGRPPRTALSDEWSGYGREVTRALDRTRAAQEEVARAAIALAAARFAWTATEQREEALLRHRERWAEDLRQARERRDERDADDRAATAAARA